MSCVCAQQRKIYRDRESRLPVGVGHDILFLWQETDLIVILLVILIHSGSTCPTSMSKSRRTKRGSVRQEWNEHKNTAQQWKEEGKREQHKNCDKLDAMRMKKRRKIYLLDVIRTLSCLCQSMDFLFGSDCSLSTQFLVQQLIKWYWHLPHFFLRVFPHHVEHGCTDEWVFNGTWKEELTCILNKLSNDIWSATQSVCYRLVIYDASSWDRVTRNRRGCDTCWSSYLIYRLLFEGVKVVFREFFHDVFCMIPWVSQGAH